MTTPLAGSVANAVQAAKQLPAPPAPEDRFLLDLGFDSLDIAALALELEEELGQPVIVNDWIAAATSIDELTVASLTAYLEAQLEA